MCLWHLVLTELKQQTFNNRYYSTILFRFTRNYNNVWFCANEDWCRTCVWSISDESLHFKNSHPSHTRPVLFFSPGFDMYAFRKKSVCYTVPCISPLTPFINISPPRHRHLCCIPQPQRDPETTAAPLRTPTSTIINLESVRVDTLWPLSHTLTQFNTGVHKYRHSSNVYIALKGSE